MSTSTLAGAPCIAETQLTAAARLQHALLPPSPFTRGGWTAAHHFAPAGPVGGDIVDLIPAGDRLYFLLADVSGKGVGASLVTAYLHAIFRSLVPVGLPLEQLMARASALLCSSTLPAQYATLVCGYAGPDGRVTIANAGHPPPLAIGRAHQTRIVATGTPAGLFCDSTYSTATLTLADGDTLLMYSDGVTEATGADGDDYGLQRLQRAAAAASGSPAEVLAALMNDHAAFTAATAEDDVTLLAIRRQE